MAQTATLHSLQIELSDIERNVYESLSLRVAQHPSEDASRMVARVLAYCLLYEEGLEFGKGLSDADDPALWLKEPDGRIAHWVDVGHPSADRMHRASKAAERMTIVCHKDVEGLRREAGKRTIHQAASVEVWLLPPAMVVAVAEASTRRSSWSVMNSSGDLMVTVDNAATPIEGSVTRCTLDAL